MHFTRLSSTGPSERLTSIGAVEASTIRQRRPAVPGVAPYIWKLDTLCPKAAHSLWNRPANTPTRFTTRTIQYFRAPQSKSVDKRHCFVIYMMSAKYPVRGFNFQCQGPGI